MLDNGRESITENDMVKFKHGTKLSEYQKKAKEGGVCEYCKQKKERLTIDHIIPQSIVILIDPDAVLEDEENFAFVCERCNKYKGGRIDALNPKTKPLLFKYASSL